MDGGDQKECEAAGNGAVCRCLPDSYQLTSSTCPIPTGTVRELEGQPPAATALATN